MTPPLKTALHLRHYSSTTDPNILLFRAFFEYLETHSPDLKDLPTPLPINDPAMRKRVFTHRSAWGRSTTLFQDPVDDPNPPDNERLEFLGDSILSTVTCLLLHERYPRYRVGPTSKVRSLVICNANLATICRFYNMQEELQGAQSQLMTLKKSEQVQADLFESYIAGVYLDRGLEDTKQWLYGVLDPFVKAAFEVVKHDHLLRSRSPPPYSAEEGELTDQDRTKSPNEDELGSKVDPGTLSFFNQLCQQRKYKVEWITSDAPGSKTTPLWRVEVKVDGKILGSGVATGKKGAKILAARQALPVIEGKQG
ncbi:hypothetical protein FRC01_001256 [Tulasnella sp. 417]|nr:hypothetical protein FRC01_001256 [Tulasnella sp. 417]